MGTYATFLVILVSIIFSCSVHYVLAACNESEYFCTAELLKNVMSAFSESNISIRDPSATNSALNSAYGNFSARCLGISQNLRAVRLLMPALGDSENEQQQTLAQLFTRMTGYRIEFVLQTTARIAEEVMFGLQTNVSLYDAWILDVPSSEKPRRVGGVVRLDALAAATQEQLSDTDIHPFMQKYGAMYQNHRTAVVLGSVVPLLYWRRDIFAASKLTGPPRTWEELLAVASVLNGTDMNFDGLPDAALCWQTEECVDSGTLLASILASMTQYQGPNTGWLFRPEDMSPLAAGPPLLRALDIFRNLTRLEARTGKGCAYVHSAFFNGTCALTIKSAQQFKVAQLKYPSLHGLVGVAPMPGSTEVWDRAANAWLSCGEDATSSPCPYATLETQLLLPSKQTGATSSSSSTTGNSTFTTSNPNSSPGLKPSGNNSAGGSLSRRTMFVAAPPPPQAASSEEITSRRVWVNRSPYCGMTAFLGSVDVRSPPDYVAAAFSFFALVTKPEISWALLGTDSAVGPFRLQHLDLANIPRWVAMNYSQLDLEPFLNSTRLALEHPNAALPLRMPGASTVRDVLFWASQQALASPVGSLTAVAGATQARLVAALDSNLPLAEVQRIYWETIGFHGLTPPSYDRESWFASLGARIGLGLAVAVTGAALLVLAAVLWYRRRRERLQRTLFGRALAPGASVATSLVVTDIVDSTRLWETVSTAAMTRAVQLHHETLRSLLQLHNGYESATEGDAFILSFYSAADAVTFALRAQAALLYQPWPEELFRQDSCRPQYALCQASGWAADRHRTAIARLPRGAAHGLPMIGSQQGQDDSLSGTVAGAAAAASSGPLWLHRYAGPRGGAGAEENVGGQWLAGGTSQLHSGKLKMVTTALSLPLKRRPRGTHAGSSTIAAAPTALLANEGPSRQLSSTTPQLTFTPLPPAPPVQPRDGFASHSLSQILLNGSSRCILAGGGSASGSCREVRTADVSVGGVGRSLQPRAALQRESQRPRAWWLTASRARYHTTNAASDSARPCNTTEPQVFDRIVESDRELTQDKGIAGTSGRAALGSSAGDGLLGRGKLTAPVSLSRNADFSIGAGAAKVQAQQRENLTARDGNIDNYQSGDSGLSVHSGASARLHTLRRGISRLHDNIGGGGLGRMDRGTEPAKASTAPAAAWDEVATAAAVVPTPVPVAMVTNGTGSQPLGMACDYICDATVLKDRDVTSTVGPAELPAVGTDAANTSGNAEAYERTSAPKAVLMDSPEAARNGDGVKATALSNEGGDEMGTSVAEALITLAVSEMTMASPVGGEVEESAAAVALEALPSIGSSACDSDGLSAATFTGQWKTNGPPSVPSASVAAAAQSPRVTMSMPLPKLGIEAAGASGADDNDDPDLEQLLAIRGSDIRSVPGVESDPEPDRESGLERHPKHPDLEGEAGMEVRPTRRIRGSRFRRSRISHAMGLVGRGLTSEGVKPVYGLQGPLAAQGFVAAVGGAASVVSSAVTSASGALTASFGLMPYRRTSVPNQLAALMRSGTAGGSLGLDGVIHGVSAHGVHSGSESPSSYGVGLVRSLALGAYYQQLFRSCQPGAPGAVLFAGGLSVRMGVHSGVSSTQVSYNRVAGRTQYNGTALELAKTVCDAAQGGMVLLSRSAFDQLALGRTGATSSGREPPHVVLHMGRHVLKADPLPQELYMAQSRELLSRLAFLGPVRSSEQVEPGVLEAPLGEVSMAVVGVVGLPTLLAWDKDTAEEALATFRRVVVTVAMRRLGGHLVEETPARVLAAFGHPFDAVRWAAACEALLKEADWSEALLSHELAEEVQGPVLLDSHMDAPVLMGDGELSRMLFRGLRIKGAVDCSPVKAALLPATGRLNYRGNLMHNVQRIAAYVSTGQVVCTRRAWRGYERALQLAADVAGAADVVGACLGCHSIRGVGDKVELWSIRLEDLEYEASYHRNGLDGGDNYGVEPNIGGRLKMLLPSPMPVPTAVDLASPAAATAALGGDAVGSRLGASLADTMAAQSRVWDVTGEELQNMLSE